MLVSVIIPTYNRAGTIERAVNSVLSQTWKSQEIIIVDDGSTDRTPEVLSQYGDRIKLIRQPNQGPSAARNTGIQAATGEIISFLDSDDEWLAEKNERQLKLLEAAKSDGVQCCVCNARMEFPTRTVSSFDAARLRPDRSEGIWTNATQMLLYHFFLFNQVVLVRRQALDQAGYFRPDLRFLEDYDLALRLSLLGPWAFIADPLVVWHGYETNSLSQGIGKLQASCQAHSILNDLKHSPRYGPQFPDALMRRRLRRMRQLIIALRLSAKEKRGTRLLGEALLKIIEGYEAAYRRLPVAQHMQTRSSGL